MRRPFSAALLVALALTLGACGRDEPEPVAEPKAPPLAQPAEPAAPREPVAEPVVEAALEEVEVPTSAGDVEVELAIDLPTPQFVGTPRNIPADNLDPTTGKRRAPFMVPEGTVLLSAEAPVTSSDEEPIIGEIEQVTDGDKEAYDGSYVELGPGSQYVQIDLGRTCEVRAIVVWHYHSQARVYRDLVVQVGGDPDLILDAVTVYNNDHDNSSGLGVGEDYEYVETNEGRLIDTGSVRGRYVRLYSNGSTASPMNHYTEVEVFGRPVD